MKTEKLALSGYEYSCTQLPARVGLRVAARLAQALAPGVKALPEEGFELTSLAAMLEPVLGNPALCDTVDYLVSIFAERTEVTNLQAGTTQPLARVIDLQFADSYDDMITWLVFSVKLSLSSFFRGARGLAVQVAAAGAGKSVSTSPISAPMTGQSGG